MAKAAIHHVALRVGDLPYFVDFFHQVFGMSVTKQREKDGVVDSIWLDGGIQLLIDRSATPRDGVMDHVSFLVDNIEETKKKAEPYGGTPCPGKAAHWFEIPQGIVFELKTE